MDYNVLEGYCKATYIRKEVNTMKYITKFVGLDVSKEITAPFIQIAPDLGIAPFARLRMDGSPNI